jgi:hypothetical protein
MCFCLPLRSTLGFFFADAALFGGGGDQLHRRRAFTFAVIAADADSDGRAGGLAERAVEPQVLAGGNITRAFGSAGFAMPHRPLHIAGDAEKRSVKADHLLQQPLELGILLLELGQLRSHMRQQTVQMPGIKQRVGIRQRGLADDINRQKTVDRFQLAHVLRAPQRTNHRIEKRQQIRHHRIVIKQHAIVMRIQRSQLLEIILYETHLLAPHQRREPNPGTPGPPAFAGRLWRGFGRHVHRARIRPWLGQQRKLRLC